jgi:hypothetical protein
MPKATTPASTRTWLDCYEELKALIGENPSIRMGKGFVSFASQDAKALFHALMKEMTRLFAVGVIEERRLVDREGIRAFNGIEASLCARSGIEGIALPKAMADYLADPLQSADRILSEPALWLLQGQLDPSGFSQLAKERYLVPRFAELDRYLYEAWIAYGLIDALDPVEFWNVRVNDESAFCSSRTNNLRMGHQIRLRDFRLPEAMFRAAGGDCWAYKIERKPELYHYDDPGRKRDFTAGGNTENHSGRRSLMLYRIDGVESVPVIAQRSKRYVMPPDLLVEHLSVEELASPDTRETLGHLNRVLRCVRPIQVALRGDEDEQVLGGQGILDSPNGFVTHAVGYGKKSLQMIARQLFKDEETRTDYV